MSRRAIIATLIAAGLFFPSAVLAFPFGGRASVVLICPYNSTIYVNLGPPRGGEYIWTTATKTYLFGPPSHAGQWLLGLAGGPYYCIYRISPLTIYTGISMTMLGSSGPAAPAGPSLGGGSTMRPMPAPAPSPTTPTPAPTQTPGAAGKVLLSEIYYAVDTAHGAKPQNEWVEIYNGTTAAVQLNGWSIQDAAAVDYLPSAILAPGARMVIAATSTTRALWNINADAFVSVQSSLGDGLSNTGDRIVLRNASGAVVDALSWGTNKTVFDPAMLPTPYGYAMWRSNVTRDTDTSQDWFATATPTPGR